MINIVAVLPCCGKIIAELIWSAAWCILNRIFIAIFTSIMLLISIFMILRFNKHQINIIQVIIIIKCYILYWNVSMNLLISIIFINLWSHLNLYITIVFNNKFYPFSWFMVTVVILVSSIVNPTAKINTTFSLLFNLWYNSYLELLN